MIIEQEYYGLNYDRVFKSVIANPEDKRIMNKILSDILEEEVEVVEYLPTELPINKKEEKINILDILVKTKNNTLINVEINTRFDNIIKERNLVYYASLYSQRLKRGSYYYPEIKVIHIDLNYGRKNKEELKEEYYLETKEGKKYSDNFKIITINIAGYKQKWYDENIKGKKEHIYIVMLDANKEELEELSKQDELIREVKEKMYILNEDGSYTRTISREEDMKIIAKDRERYAKEEGIKEEKENIAKSLLKKGMAIKEIAEITELSENEIEKIKSYQ